MTVPRRTSPAAPVRHVHLGLGNFFRAHQAWYTHRCDGGQWGIAAFAGRSRTLAETLGRQDGLYTLVERGADGDRFTRIESLVAAHGADEHPAWLDYFGDPAVQIVTSTITEAGYTRAADGGLAADGEAVRRDIEALRANRRAPVVTAVARMVAGLSARRAADAGALTFVPCDNLPENGAALARVVHDLAGLVEPGLTAWIRDHVGFVTTMVDRITPATADADRTLVAERTGVTDLAPVVTEPFSEWVLAGVFRAGRPRWEDAGATLVDDVAPHENRKLRLLNGAHSLLAYVGPARGHDTVAGAMADPVVRRMVEDWWDEACRHLDLPRTELDAYRAALARRFLNPSIRHLLAQIAADGTIKLPVRILPTLRAEREAGRLPSGAAHALAGWVCHLRGLGAPVADVRGEEAVAAAGGPRRDGVRAALGLLDPLLADDDTLVGAVSAYAADLGG